MGIQFSWLEHQTGTLLTQVRFLGAARDFSPRVNFQCRLSYGVRTPLCAIACTNICAHVKDPVVHARIRWIRETLKHQACHRRQGSATLSQLDFRGENEPEFPMGQMPSYFPFPRSGRCTVKRNIFLVEILQLKTPQAKERNGGKKWGKKAARVKAMIDEDILVTIQEIA